MTEEQWLVCRDPALMLKAIDVVSHRKLWLFGCSCCRRIWNHLDEASRRTVEISEAYADGCVSHEELLDASIRADATAVSEAHKLGAVAACLTVVDPARNGLPFFKVDQAALGTAEQVVSVLRSAGASGHELAEERAIQAALLRDVIGNPFRLLGEANLYRTPAVVSLAQEIYDQRSFERIPEVANALEEAGSADSGVLEHLQSSGPHVRGCWVIDLLLGRA